MKKFFYTMAILLFYINLLAQTADAPLVGDGSMSSPYEIATLNNLYWLTQNNSEWGKYFVQTADIDASLSSGWSGGGFSPIGTASATTKFTGQYDGQGHTISGITINRSGYVGMFGYAKYAVIKNIVLTNIDITSAGSYTGGLVGLTSDTTSITNCYVTGSVAGNAYTGGLIGYSSIYTKINYCFTDAVVQGGVSGGSYTGGLCGYDAQGTITNCYSVGNVSGEDYVGGFIGRTLASNVTKCYSSGDVTGTGSNVGGLVGNKIAGIDSNCFWDMDASGQTSSATGTGESTSNMKTESTFSTNGWDFTSVWSISPGYNNGYPYLGSVAPLPVELTTFTASINNNKVLLSWSTATEVNNYGFELERQLTTTPGSATPSSSRRGKDVEWIKIGFVPGSGTSNSTKEYSFIDKNVPAGNYKYRLKQIDNDGTFEYSDEVVVDLNSASDVYTLQQNYPNPFNPATKINFAIPQSGNVTLKVYNVLGEEVATLVNSNMQAGNHSVSFNGKNLSSGIYVYRIVSGSYTDVKKMLLLK